MLKKVVVKANKGFKMYGKCIRPGEVNTFNIRQIFGLLSVGGGVKVFEVLDNNELLQLNKTNYDKVNHSSVPSVANTEVDHKEPVEKIDEVIPTQSDVSSNEEKVEEPVSEIVEEPETIEEEKETVVDESEVTANDETPDEPTVVSETTEEPGTEENEESIIEEAEEVGDDATTEKVVGDTEKKGAYNISKKSNKYYKK